MRQERATHVGALEQHRVGGLPLLKSEADVGSYSSVLDRHFEDAVERADPNMSLSRPDLSDGTNGLTIEEEHVPLLHRT